MFPFNPNMLFTAQPMNVVQMSSADAHQHHHKMQQQQQQQQSHFHQPHQMHAHHAMPPFHQANFNPMHQQSRAQHQHLQQHPHAHQMHATAPHNMHFAFAQPGSGPPPAILINAGAATFPRICPTPIAVPRAPSIEWPLNPANYQDVANDQVDWAALAQQWIHMKETCTTDELLDAPPAPRISQALPLQSSRCLSDEQGEAPMTMDSDDDSDGDGNPAKHAAPIGEVTGDPVSAVWDRPPPTFVNKPPLSDAPWPQNTPPPPIISQRAWNRKSSNRSGSPTKLQHREQRGSNARQGNFAVRTPNANKNNRANCVRPHFQHSFADASNMNAIEPSTTPLDAAKRKTLPTWIRLGLEQMEREKQRQVEHDEREKERIATLEKQKTRVQELASGLLAGKSKFDSDSEPDMVDDARQAGSDSTVKANQTVAEQATSEPCKEPPISRAEFLKEMMITVRKTLTEILLEVTNEEILKISKESLSRMRLKAQTAQTVKKSALSTIVGGLGLGIYADSDDEEDDEANDSDRVDDGKMNEADSDEELKASIIRKNVAFEARILEIEAKCQRADEAERLWLAKDDAPNARVKQSNGQSAIGEVQHDQKHVHANASSHNSKPTSLATERKTSRFSDAPNTAHASLIHKPAASHAAPSLAAMTTSKTPLLEKPDVQNVRPVPFKSALVETAFVVEAAQPRGRRTDKHRPCSRSRSRSSFAKSSSKSSRSRKSASSRSRRSRSKDRSKKSRRSRSRSSDRTKKSTARRRSRSPHYRSGMSKSSSTRRPRRRSSSASSSSSRQRY